MDFHGKVSFVTKGWTNRAIDGLRRAVVCITAKKKPSGRVDKSTLGPTRAFLELGAIKPTTSHAVPSASLRAGKFPQLF